MTKEELKIEFPVKLEELLNYTFNFDNLIKAISYLHNNDINLLTDLKDFNKRIKGLEGLKNDVEEIKIQARNIQNSNDNLNRSLQNMQEKFIKIDFKLNEINKKTSEAKANLEEQDRKIQLHNKNLDHLNKVVEDNIKKTNIAKDDIEANKKEIISINEKINELKRKDKDLEELIHMKNELLNSRIDENKNEIVRISNNLEELNSSFKNFKNEIDIKNEEFENSISNIINNISSGNNADVNIKKIGDKKDDDNTGLLIKAVNDNISLNSKIAQIEVDQKNFKEFISKYNLDKDKYNSDIGKNGNDIINIQNNINNIKKEIELISKGINNGDFANNYGSTDLSKYVTNDAFKKLSDNIRILTSSFGTTPSRDEFETSIRKINSRLETIEFIQQGVTSGPRTMINSDLVQKEGEKTTYITQAQKIIMPVNEEGKYKYMEDIKQLIIKTINEEMKNISLINNPKFIEIFQNITKCEDEISKNDRSIINIRNILAVSPTQNDLMLIRQDIERLSDESKKKFNEIIRTINGDEDEEEDEEDVKNGLAGFCLKKKKNL